MKKQLTFVIGGGTIIGLLFVAMLILKSPKTPAAPSAFEVVKTQIDQLEDKKERARSNVGQITPELAKMIETNPDYVAVCLVVARARSWPGITPAEEQTILVTARTDSAGALNDLQRCLHEGVTRSMIEGKYDPATENRHLWNNNNGSTAMLFVKFPLAERIGKKKELLKERLEGYREGRKDWFADDLTESQYIRWYGSGRWPFPGEEPPVYKPED